MQLKAKKILMTALLLFAATILAGCGHGPWFHGHGHGRAYGYYRGSGHPPGYQAGPDNYRGSDDNPDYWRK